jgi:hypothetical protein
MKARPGLVLRMSTRRVHRVDCRTLTSAGRIGGMDLPIIARDQIRSLKTCRICKPTE